MQDANQVSHLSTALLDFARASYDVSQITFVALRLDEILVDSKITLCQKNPNYNVGINYMDDLANEDESNYDLSGNPYLLQIAFLNLMENACKYSQDKSCNVEIEVRNSSLEIRFIDHGIGISEKDQLKIFDLFYRGANKNYDQGNGIGLSIVQRIIEIHHGTISLESQEGKGSIFKIQFPKN